MQSAPSAGLVSEESIETKILLGWLKKPLWTILEWTILTSFFTIWRVLLSKSGKMKSDTSFANLLRSWQHENHI